MHKEFRVRVSIVIVILYCSAAVARSQDIDEASAGTRSLGPLPFQLILPREHLMGDWYGTRTWLEERGVTPALTFETDSLGNPSGGKEQGFTTANNVGLDLNLDLEKLWGLEGGSFLLSMSYRFGGSLSANYIHNVFTVQQVFGGETFHLINLTYQQKLFDDASTPTRPHRYWRRLPSLTLQLRLRPNWLRWQSGRYFLQLPRYNRLSQ